MESTTLWSVQQNNIFDWFKCGTGNLVVRARAGTGKTSSIIEAINFAPEETILLAAFNKEIAKELQSKLKNEKAQAQTLHAVGFRELRNGWNGVQLDGERAERIARQVCGVNAQDWVVNVVRKLASLGKNICPLNYNIGTLMDLADEYDLIHFDDNIWNPHRIATLAVGCMEKARVKDGTCDFDDMIYIPLVNNWISPKYDLVVVDECQDLNTAQILLAQKLCTEEGRIVVVGDDRQCHPARTKISLTGRGVKSIEDIKIGDELVSYYVQNSKFMGTKVQGRKVLDVGSRLYTGNMYNITLKDRTVKSTSEHRWPVKLVNLENKYVLYLMIKGIYARIGTTVLHRSGGKKRKSSSNGVSQRAQQEKADEAWILDVFDNKEDAHLAEAVSVAKFGITDVCFNYARQFKPTWIKNYPNYLNKIHAKIGNNLINAEKCLVYFGRDIRFPIWKKGGVNGTTYNSHIGKKTFITQACNLISGIMAVRTFDGDHSSYTGSDNSEDLGHSGKWETLNIDYTFVENEPVFSLSVQPSYGGRRLYISNGVVTHNSIYGFRGADSSSIDRLKKELKAIELPLTITYRCPKLVVDLARTIVPDYQPAPEAPEGRIEHITIEQMYKSADIGDFILSRKNSPLAEIALRLLREGKRAIIKGKDIGKGLVAITNKLKAKSVTTFLSSLNTYETKQTARLLSSKKNVENKIELLKDQCETLRSLSMGLASVDEIKTRILSLFADLDPKDNKNIIMCSSVHKAKGLEANIVFVLRDTLKDNKGGEEANIAYVAFTRTKKVLNLVEGKI